MSLLSSGGWPLPVWHGKKLERSKQLPERQVHACECTTDHTRAKPLWPCADTSSGRQHGCLQPIAADAVDRGCPVAQSRCNCKCNLTLTWTAVTTGGMLWRGSISGDIWSSTHPPVPSICRIWLTGSTVSAVNMHLRSLLSASLGCVLFYVVLLRQMYFPWIIRTLKRIFVIFREWKYFMAGLIFKVGQSASFPVAS